MFLDVDWRHAAEHMRTRHGIDVVESQRGAQRPRRVVISPDYNSTSGKSVRIIGFSQLLDDLISVIVLEHEGVEYA